MIDLNKTLLSEAKTLEDIKSIDILDAYFEVFTKRIIEYGVIDFATSCRYSATTSSGRVSIIGYSFETSLSDEFDPESESIPDKFDYDWDYILFTGEFYESIEIQSVNQREIKLHEKSVLRFFSKSVSGDFIDDLNTAEELQRELNSLYKSDRLNTIKIIYITNGLLKEKADSTLISKKFESPINIEYWDLEKLNDLSKLKSKKIPINIDLSDSDYNYATLPALQKNVNESITSYLAIFPGAFIADLYDKYHTRLLENNVRVFLSLRRKHNAGMAKTIENEPELFFTYNNGLSVTASEVIIKDNKICSLTDLQIVNGGQTTATLSYARKKRKLDLSKVFVQVKLTKISDNEIYSEYVSDISKYSNSQTSIRKSDFYTNDPYLIELEKVSQGVSANQGGILSYYFFERMSGQYNETKNKQGTPTRVKIWEKKFPKKDSFNKLDFARWSNIMLLLPHLAATGAEKQFESYMRYKNKPILSKSYVKTLIGFGSLFDRARKVCGRRGGVEFPPIIDDPSVGMSATIYGMAYLHYISKGRFDYHLVFNKVYGESYFDEILKECIKAVWIPMTQFGGMSVQEQSKKQGCWKAVCSNTVLKSNIIDEINEYSISKEEYLKRNTQNIQIDYDYFFLLDEIFDDENLLLDKMAITSKNFLKQYIPFIEEVKNCIQNKDKIIRKVVLFKLKELKESVIEFQRYTGSKYENIQDFGSNSIDNEELNYIHERLMNKGGLSFMDLERIGFQYIFSKD